MKSKIKATFLQLILNDLINIDTVKQILINKSNETKFIFNDIDIGFVTINTLHIFFNDNLCIFKVNYGLSNSHKNIYCTKYYKNKNFTPYQLEHFLNSISLLKRQNSNDK